MKKLILLALMTALLVLTGCSSEQDGWEMKLEEKRQEMQEAVSISFTAAITADLDDEEFSCTLLCISNGEGVTVEVIEPELIAGIKAQLGPDNSIEYDGIQLYVGDLTQDGLSPVSAVPMLIDSLKSGYVERMWRENTDETDLLVAQIYESEQLTVKLWLEENGMSPVYAEVISDGKAVLKCGIDGFTYE